MAESYRDVVLSTSKGLNLEESRELAYLYELPARFHQCNRSLDVLMQLEVEQKISESNPEALAKAMERIDKQILASKIRKSKWYKNALKKPKKGASTTTRSPPPASEEIYRMEVDMIKMQIENTMRHVAFLNQHANSWGTPTADLSPELDSIMSSLDIMVRKLDLSSSSSDEDTTSPPSSLAASCTSPGPMQEQLCEELRHHLAVVKGNPPPTSKKPTKKQPPPGAIPVLVGVQVKKPIEEEGMSDTETSTGTGTGDSGFVDSTKFLKEPLVKKPVPVEEDDSPIYEVIATEGYMKLNREEITEDEYAQVSTTTTTVCHQETHESDKNEEDDGYAELLNY